MDLARQQEDEAVRLAALQRRHELDTTVDEVLQSLATGQYGRCIECGRHIALARLRAMPLAVRCLACQDRFERAARIAAACESRYEMPNVQEVVL
jgi:DnaK suppressor protein